MQLDLLKEKLREKYSNSLCPKSLRIGDRIAVLHTDGSGTWEILEVFVSAISPSNVSAQANGFDFYKIYYSLTPGKHKDIGAFWWDEYSSRPWALIGSAGSSSVAHASAISPHTGKLTALAPPGGCKCKRCALTNPDAGPNQEDGTYLCFNCRSW
jgi:hypothetical protein